MRPIFFDAMRLLQNNKVVANVSLQPFRSSRCGMIESYLDSRNWPVRFAYLPRLINHRLSFLLGIQANEIMQTRLSCRSWVRLNSDIILTHRGANPIRRTSYIIYLHKILLSCLEKTRAISLKP